MDDTSSTRTLNGRKVAFIVANEGIEQAELEQPWQYFQALGAEPVLIATEAGKVQAFNHLDRGDAFEAMLATSEATYSDYVGIVLPGGVANADQLRTDEHAVALIHNAFQTGIPVAVICHGPWLLVEADVLRGRTLTSWPSLQTDLQNAGATWVDRQVEVDATGSNTLISSRKPSDIPAFNEAAEHAFLEFARN